MADLEYTLDDGVGTILLNRPQRRNAFTFAMLDEWSQILREARHDEAVRVVVVTGAGGAFCAGVDLDDFAGHNGGPYDDKALLTDRVHPVAHAVEALDKPYIAGVSGVAVGAGMDMALMADIRIASASARFSEAYVNVGLVPGDGGSHLLPRIVGRAKALELPWTGEFVDADQALRMGLVSYVHADATFDDNLREFASRLASAPPLATRMIKRATVFGEHMSFAASLDMISSHQAVIQSTRDSQEAMAAFKEKRPGKFTGS